MENKLTEWDGRKVIWQDGLYFKVEGDVRMYFDNKIASSILNTTPNYWEDTCPKCGNKENISGCRCFLSHRTCPKCGEQWRWDLDKKNACLKIIIESSNISHHREVGG